MLEGFNHCRLDFMGQMVAKHFLQDIGPADVILIGFFSLYFRQIEIPIHQLTEGIIFFGFQSQVFLFLPFKPSFGKGALRKPFAVVKRFLTFGDFMQLAGGSFNPPPIGDMSLES